MEWQAVMPNNPLAPNPHCPMKTQPVQCPGTVACIFTRLLHFLWAVFSSETNRVLTACMHVDL